ncbi:serine/arginine repetitive matrix protein 1 isoform X1 [Vanessa cardui]|uniref:serine/arginine repetitive matrix protein 1 isoform X1 n=1 Tax=Vanessa cardui TaxID=171605 RepID=UPI001F133B24|nr:serine/arginine repetitive matrix protein 1 isoform X1 [Vanessa cardui]
MAVYAAHLTRTLQGTPSVFQVAAQEALGGTVKPALRKLVEYVAAVYPNKCGWCERWYDELYLLLDCTLQYHYLKHYAASFSECFYGLFRVPISPSTEFSSGPRLPQNLERGSLALLVLLPYVREKVEKFVDKWREDLEDGRLEQSRPRAQGCRPRVERAALCGRGRAAGRAGALRERPRRRAHARAAAARPRAAGRARRPARRHLAGLLPRRRRRTPRERGGDVPHAVARVQRRGAARSLRRAAAALVGRAPPARAGAPARAAAAAAAAAARGGAGAQRVSAVPPALARARRAAGVRLRVLLRVREPPRARRPRVPRHARARRARRPAPPLPRRIGAEPPPLPRRLGDALPRLPRRIGAAPPAARRDSFANGCSNYYSLEGSNFHSVTRRTLLT